MTDNNAPRASYLQSIQPTTPSTNTPAVSRELLESTARLQATLSDSINKMQKIIDETRTQLPDQPQLPVVPGIYNKKDASPPWDCGCQDELYTREGCQCYKVVTSAAADLAAGFQRGLKRKEPEKEDQMEVDSVLGGMGRENTSSPAAGREAQSWTLPRRPAPAATSEAGRSEQLMLQRHPEDVSQGRQIMPLPKRGEQQTGEDDQAHEQRWV